MRVLDLGCDDGLTPDKLGLPSVRQITGIDVKPAAVAKAHNNFPRRMFVCSAAEKRISSGAGKLDSRFRALTSLAFHFGAIETMVCGSHEAVASSLCASSNKVVVRFTPNGFLIPIHACATS